MRSSIVRKLAATATALSLTLQYAGPAAAAAATCFQSADVEADQAIRYENELMVLSDTCGDDTYREFTLRNRNAIIDYQKQMMNYFHRTGARSPQAALDTFLTRIANEEALRAAHRVGPDRVQPRRYLPGGGEIPEYAGVPAPRRGARGGE